MCLLSAVISFLLHKFADLQRKESVTVYDTHYDKCYDGVLEFSFWSPLMCNIIQIFKHIIWCSKQQHQQQVKQEQQQ